MQIGKSKEKLEKVIVELTNHTITHFNYGERFFEQFAYVDKEDHIMAHKTFINKITNFKNDFEAGNVPILKDWITKHINITDKNMLNC